MFYRGFFVEKSSFESPAWVQQDSCSKFRKWRSYTLALVRSKEWMSPFNPRRRAVCIRSNRSLAWCSIRRRGPSLRLSCPSYSAWRVPPGRSLPAWNRCRNNPRPHPSPGLSSGGCACRAGPWTFAGRCIAAWISGYEVGHFAPVFFQPGK